MCVYSVHQERTQPPYNLLPLSITFLLFVRERVLKMPEIPEEFDVFHLPHVHMTKIKKDIDTEVRTLTQPVYY